MAVENSKLDFSDSHIQIILKSSFTGRIGDGRTYSTKPGFLDWIAKESSHLFLKDSHFPSKENLLIDDDYREPWKYYMNIILGRLFPPRKNRLVVRKSGLKSEYDEWLLFPHPFDARNVGLEDSKQNIPGLRVVIKKRKYDEIYDLEAIGFKRVKIGELRPTDGIITANFNGSLDGSYGNRIGLPLTVKNWLSELENVRLKTNERLDEWIRYIEWEKQKATDMEWGVIITNVIPPKTGGKNWKYEVLVDNKSRKRISRNDSLYAVHRSISKSDKRWERKNGNENFPYFKEKEHEFKIGKLEKIIPGKKNKKNSKNTYLTLKVSPPDPENPFDVPLVNPGEFFIVNNVGITLIQIQRQEKAINRLRDQEATYNDLHEWIFDISQAKSNPYQLEELKHPKLPNTNLNNDQEMAVRKALSAQDVCLIQGPPGTGKTTVIAEIINQATQEEKKVLLASQSNLAVDNALGRLGEVPNVRPIRRHSRSASKDEEAEKFIENNVVKKFFIPSIRNHCLNIQDEDNTMIKLKDRMIKAKIEIPQIHIQYDELNNSLKVIQKESIILNEKLKILKEKFSLQTKDKDLLNSNKHLLDTGSLDEFPESLVKMLDIPNELIEKIIDKDRNNRALPLLKELNQLLNQKNMTDFFQDPDVIKLNKEREKIDITSTDSNVINRLLEINKELKRKVCSAKDKSWPKWSGQVNDIIIKLEKIPFIIDQDLWDSLKQEVRKTKPTEELDIIKEKIHSLINERVFLMNENMTDFNMEIDEGINLVKLDYFKYVANINELLDNSKLDIEKTDKQLNEKSEQINLLIKRIKNLRTKWDNSIKTISDQLKNKYDQINKDNKESILKDISNWKITNVDKINQANKWTKIRGEWLEELENPSDIVLNDLQDIYMKLVNIEGVTTSFCARWSWYNKYLSEPFDIVIIDEVSKATPPELLQALLLGRTAVLVGDHKQLPPTFRHKSRRGKRGKEAIEEFAATEIDDSERLKKFERMVTSSLFKELFIDADDSIKQSLTIQYRMHRQIMRCVNQFYGLKLQSGLSEALEADKKTHGLTFVKKDDWGVEAKGSELLIPSKHVYWVDSTFNREGDYNEEVQWKNGSSKANEREIIIGSHIIDSFNELIGKTKNYVPRSEWIDHPMLKHLTKDRLPIGFITFYGGQVGQFKETVLQKKNWTEMRDKWPNLSLQVNTVDHFQGGERPVIIVSTVVSKPLIKKEKQSFYKNVDPNKPSILRKRFVHEGGIPMPTTDFIRSYERINVAFSRAQNLLIIIGNRWGIEKVEITIPDDFNKRKRHRKKKAFKDIINGIEQIGGTIDGRTIV